jgi:hypothetical protein
MRVLYNISFGDDEEGLPTLGNNLNPSWIPRRLSLPSPNAHPSQTNSRNRPIPIPKLHSRPHFRNSVTAASIHCCLANGKSSGVRSVVALSHPFEGSLTSHCRQSRLDENSRRQYRPLLLIESHPARILLACTSRTSLFLYRGHTSSRSSLMEHLAICFQRHPTGKTGKTYWTSRGLDQVR